jgi:protein ImuB
MLTQHGEGVRQLQVSLFRLDGKVHHIEAGTSRPLRDPLAIARLFHERLEAKNTSEDDAIETGYGFDLIRLAALHVERKDQEQTHWDEPLQDQNELAGLIDRLGARLGLRRVTRLQFQDTHIPEFAVHSVPAANFKPSSKQALLPASSGALPSRPNRLLQKPERIETIASVPDGPPLRFRWRRVMHEVIAIEGPERIAAEWWKNESALTRDYFRAEDSKGERFWLYREGLFNRESMQPRWFMHGFFA